MAEKKTLICTRVVSGYGFGSKTKKRFFFKTQTKQILRIIPQNVFDEKDAFEIRISAYPKSPSYHKIPLWERLPAAKLNDRG